MKVYYHHYNKKRHNFLVVLRDMGAPFQDVTQKVNELSFIGFLLASSSMATNDRTVILYSLYILPLESS